MSKENKLEDKVYRKVDLTPIHSNDIRKYKIYDGHYFVKRDDIKIALQDIINEVNNAEQYSGKDIKDKLSILYQKL